MKQPIKDASKGYFESTDLSNSKMVELEQLIDQHTAKPSSRFKPQYLIASLTACAVLVLVSYFIHALLFNNYVNISEAIASEVARNHIKMKPLEVSTDTLMEARQFFNDLDFAITGSAMIAKEKLQGGRYCSIQGVTAAQLRYQDLDGDLFTLYEVEYDPRIFGKQPNINQGMAPNIMMVKGLEVRLWVEKGLLMVLAKDTTP